MYQIDRLQYIESQDTIMLFEFFLVNDIEKFIENFEGESKAFKTSYIEERYLKKLSTLWKLSVNNETHLLIIIYDLNADKIAFVERSRYKDSFNWEVMDFKIFQQKFIAINNMGGERIRSKVLGSVREGNRDVFTLDVLKTIGSCIDDNDDNGLTLTKRLLNGLSTKGFDFDLFQYIKSTGETIIYEFLKNETNYIKNYTANPMRYCWTGKTNDNKQKFISLWIAKEKLNGRLFLINYSEDVEEGIGVSEILELDINRGLLQENKYNLTYDEFIAWMVEMNSYNSKDIDYMSNYNKKKEHYNEAIFRNWETEKKSYGKRQEKIVQPIR